VRKFELVTCFFKQFKLAAEKLQATPDFLWFHIAFDAQQQIALRQRQRQGMAAVADCKTLGRSIIESNIIIRANDRIIDDPKLGLASFSSKSGDSPAIAASTLIGQSNSSATSNSRCLGDASGLVGDFETRWKILKADCVPLIHSESYPMLTHNLIPE
jgi:hypothetical protein